jgi:thiol-disulfide isomerase/thioredoxin
VSAPPSGGRSGVRRAEVVSSIVVVVLVALGVVALWPRSQAAPPADPTTATAPATDRGAVPVSDAELAPARAAAGLPACPAPSGKAAGGSLAGVTVPCLGAAGSVDLGAALAGKPALLNVWGSWCEPCRTELPVLAAYAARPGAVPVYGIDSRDDPRAALGLLTDLGVRLPMVSDPDGALRTALDVPPALPISYLVASDGTATRVDPPVPFASPDQVAAAVAGLR